MWLGRDPLAGGELTSFGTGAGVAGGPSAPCTAPAEKLPPQPGEDGIAPSVRDGATATVSDDNRVTRTWNASTDNHPAGGVTQLRRLPNGVAIATVQNPEGTAPTPTSYVDGYVPPGDHTCTADAADEIDKRSVQSASATATATRVRTRRPLRTCRSTSRRSDVRSSPCPRVTPPRPRAIHSTRHSRCR